MIQMKYILLLCFINFNYIFVDSSQSVCQTINKKCYNWKRPFDLTYFTGSPNINFWQYITKNIPKQSFWQRAKSTTECFTWAAFEETPGADDLINLPFENIIDGIEFIVTDFIHFYIEYVTTAFTTVFSWRLFRVFINPATIFGISLYVFLTKIYMPILGNIRRELMVTEDDPEYCSLCEAVQGNNLETETDIEVED